MSRDLLNALIGGDTKKVEDTFERVMSDKQTEALNVKRIAVTAEVFKTKD